MTSSYNTMEPTKTPAASLSSKYNMEALNAYNFDNIDFDVKIDKMTEEQHAKVLRDEQEYNEKVRI